LDQAFAGVDVDAGVLIAKLWSAQGHPFENASSLDLALADRRRVPAADRIAPARSFDAGHRQILA
jgi:hypothetical protein